MKSVLGVAMLALNFCLAVAQEAATPPTGHTSPAQESDATSAGQAANPAEPKGTTLIGCLSGPDSDGKFLLRSMSHRTGVAVFGPDNLKDDSGSKVKLTGSWKPGDQPAVKGKESRKFQATDIEVLAQKCEAPSEKTPVSKEKQQKQQQKSSGSASRDPTNPKQ